MEEKNKYLKGFDRANKRRMLTAALDQIRRKGEAGIGVPNCSCCFSFPPNTWIKHFKKSWGLVAQFEYEDVNHKFFTLKKQDTIKGAA